ncbi:MAG TPA: sigma-70 family RNA polymerase sigma factor [Methylomirabilota bacterium]|nr:sigma-70 family RNA polymerase sigma factor [Methylomirabilota bacterium]
MKATRRPGKKAVPSDSGPPAKEARANAAEERLLVEAAQSDPAKFGALYERHFERMYAYVAARVRDRATAEDVTSEVFHRALANLSSYEWRGVPFAAWLYRIAANAIVDQAKRAAREVSIVGDPPEPTKAEVRVIEDRARLFRMVSELPETQRQVVHQRFVEQHSIREIAERLGKTEGAIKQLQLRALERLRAQMGGSHG